MCACNLRLRINKRCRVKVMCQLNQCSAVKCFTFKCGCVIVVPHPVAPQRLHSKHCYGENTNPNSSKNSWLLKPISLRNMTQWLNNQSTVELLFSPLCRNWETGIVLKPEQSKQRDFPPPPSRSPSHEYQRTGFPFLNRHTKPDTHTPTH